MCRSLKLIGTEFPRNHCRCFANSLQRLTGIQTPLRLPADPQFAISSLLASADLIVPARIVLASIGPITSRSMREFGLEPTIQAREATLAALVEALVHYLSVDSAG